MAQNRNEPIVLSAEKARQGEIVLRKRWQRVVFIAGLAGMVVLAVAVRFFAWHLRCFSLVLASASYGLFRAEWFSAPSTLCQCSL